MFGILTRIRKNRALKAPEGVTNSWFEHAARQNWDTIIPNLDPHRVLEIGSYEGASATYLINSIASRHDLEIHCVDTWTGGIEHDSSSMNYVERRFDNNISAALAATTATVDFHKHVGTSDDILCNLLSRGYRNYFDFIYIDGSHQAPDVMCDAVLSFRLLRVGGIIAFDDYLWNEKLPEGIDLVRSPKIAIDSFTNIYARKVKIIPAPLFQLYVEKTAD